MKKIVFFSVVTLFIIVGCTQQPPITTPHRGTWQVVSWQSIQNDTLRAKLGVTFKGTEMKIWTGKYFNFVGQYINIGGRDTIVDNYGGGTYKLVGTHYEESYLYFVDKSMVGKSQRLLLEVKNDTLTQTWPCDANWQIDKKNYNVQKLVRMK